MTRTDSAVRVIPVLDLRAGWVVRAVAGRRAEYQPVQSRLSADARPRSIARALANRWGFREAYVADLDAIAGGQPDWQAWRDIAESGLRLWIDAGVGNLRRATAVLGSSPAVDVLAAIVVGLESVEEAAVLPELAQWIGRERAVFSLDLLAGRPFSERPTWLDRTALQAAETAIRAGFRRLIVLDLAAVGTGCGPPTGGLCRALRQACPDIELVSGGGVRGPQDVLDLHAAGCDAVLVSSALHDGRLELGA